MDKSHIYHKTGPSTLPTSAVPTFFLYGEPPRASGAKYLHVEALDDRSRPSEWTIRPHAHSNLNHVFLITSGRGEVRIENRPQAFLAPAAFIIPAGAIHAFAFEPETQGRVLTLSQIYLQDIIQRDPALEAVFVRPAVLEASAEAEAMGYCLKRLAEELAWTQLAHQAAAEAQLLALLVSALRLLDQAGVEGRAPLTRQAELTARFRGLVEQRYRDHDSLEAYASALNVSVVQLRNACLKAAGVAPLRLIQDRLMLEARRLLIYTTLTVAEVAYSLGYDDPAYFTRGFTQYQGCSPRAFRQREAEHD